MVQHLVPGRTHRCPLPPVQAIAMVNPAPHQVDRADLVMIPILVRHLQALLLHPSPCPPTTVPVALLSSPHQPVRGVVPLSAENHHATPLITKVPLPHQCIAQIASTMRRLHPAKPAMTRTRLPAFPPVHAPTTLPPTARPPSTHLVPHSAQTTPPQPLILAPSASTSTSPTYQP